MVVSEPALIAIDWGTTNRRVYLLGSDGAVIRSERDALGVTAVPPGGFDAAVVEVRQRFGERPMLLAGMVGADIGWRRAGYVACPATLADLATQLVSPVPDTWIVPGVRSAPGARADVMRGEEVQLLGAVARGLTPPDALLCQPGTHCKWAEMRDGAIVSFATAMTGELFAMLSRHSLLAPLLAVPVVPNDAFADGVRDGLAGDLAARLFGARAQALLGERQAEAISSYVSGLLLGADIGARKVAGRTVHILADAGVGALYRTAVDVAGGNPIAVDSHAAFVAGIWCLWEMLQ